PGPSTIYGRHLLAAVREGRVSEARVDERVATLLLLIERTRAHERPASSAEQTVDDANEREVIRRAAAAGAVLVRNERDALPLVPGSVDSIAVLGPNARVTRTQGGGSSGLQAIESVSLLRGLAERYGEDIIHYRRGVSIDKLAPIIDDDTLRTPDGGRGWRVEYYDRDDVTGPPRRVDTTLQSALTYFGAAPPGVDPFDFTVVVSGTVVDDPQGLLPRGREYFGFGSEEQLHGILMKAGVPVRIEARMRTRAGFSALRIGIRAPENPREFDDAVALAEKCGTAIVVVGTNDEWETEGHDRDSIALPGRQDELVSRVARVAERTIVVINAGAPVAMPWLKEVDAVLIGFFGGMEMSRAIADVLSGARDPGGRLPVVYPHRL
ncbi:MAG: glycoside hydrolase family 3 protein, partial [Actinobacteria bacterium]|nr:glycoside hydrolase family 3 protein [Actinomycetota bacterium]